MTPEQFWQGDATLVRAFRKAEEIRKQRLNSEMWWQGMYIYEARCNASPLFRAFGKKGAKALPYPKEPYDITPPKRKQQQSERSVEKKKMLQAKAKMEAWRAQVHTNRKQQKGGTTVNGGRNTDRESSDTN